MRPRLSSRRRADPARAKVDALQRISAHCAYSRRRLREPGLAEGHCPQLANRADNAATATVSKNHAPRNCHSIIFSHGGFKSSPDLDESGGTRPPALVPPDLGPDWCHPFQESCPQSAHSAVWAQMMLTLQPQHLVPSRGLQIKLRNWTIWVLEGLSQTQPRRILQAPQWPRQAPYRPSRVTLLANP